MTGGSGGQTQNSNLTAKRIIWILLAHLIYFLGGSNQARGSGLLAARSADVSSLTLKHTAIGVFHDLALRQQLRFARLS